MGRNRLAREASPYLLMHADNPVDWYPWGAEAFARASAENKPILLSIGYAACHWCHVMARESFEDEAVARLMNERFVNVKVDREERPEVDALYMQALARMGRPGGWPLTLFLTPDGRPFWGGTYFPPEPRHGVPAFREVLAGISDLYRRHPGQVAKNAAAAVAALTLAAPTAAPSGPSEDAVARMVAGVLARIDRDHGGLAGGPKFPHAPLFRFLWRHGLRARDARCRGAVRATLDGLLRGGIRDHLGGGFARYAVDAEWRTPHFEKMLSDNALILELLAEAWKATGVAAYAQAARETAGWVLREMTTEAGAFAASLAADSEGREGAFYTWTAAEADARLGIDAALFKKVYGVGTANGDPDGRYVLHRLAGPFPLDAAEEARLAACRQVLFEARAARVPPARDDKLLADWNGLMIRALAEAGLALGEPAWLAAAERALDALAAILDDGGRLSHAWRAGRRMGGVLDDHAALSCAALALHAATGEDRYLALARRWVDGAVKRFWDPEGGGFFLSPADGDALFVRLKTADDEATPAANGLMAEALARLHLLTGEADYRARAEATVAAFAGEAEGENLAPMATLLDAHAFMARPVQVTIVGRPADPAAAALRDAAFRAPVADLVLAFAPPGAPWGRDLPAGHPAAGKGPVGGRAAAYICLGRTCSPPVIAPQAVREALGNEGP